MYLYPFGKDLIDSRKLSLEDRPIGVLMADILLLSWERRALHRISQRVWGRIYRLLEGKPFEGVIRFDFAPEWKGSGSPLQIRGIFEVNTESPECAAAFAAAQEAYRRERGFPSFSPEVVLIRELFQERRRVAMVIGDAPVKRSWGETYYRTLSQEAERQGRELLLLSPGELMERGVEGFDALYRFGDAQPLPGTSRQFSDEFISWMLGLQRKGFPVINTLASQWEVFPGSKELLGEVLEGDTLGDLYRRVPLTQEERDRLLREKDQWCLKPDGGSSGRGVACGPFFSPEEWERELEEHLLQGGAAAYRYFSLPLVKIQGEKYRVDFNYAYYARKERITPLYGIVRIMPEEDFVASRGLINVACGAGFSFPFF